MASLEDQAAWKSSCAERATCLEGPGSEKAGPRPRLSLQATTCPSDPVCFPSVPIPPQSPGACLGAAVPTPPPQHVPVKQNMVPPQCRPHLEGVTLEVVCWGDPRTSTALVRGTMEGEACLQKEGGNRSVAPRMLGRGLPWTFRG